MEKPNEVQPFQLPEERVRRMYETVADILSEMYNAKITVTVTKKPEEVV